ncbi:MAG: hypothetical protein HIU91_14940 [Acidobacteria bacterium]|nr:hypothetical protein [Acidobacteriota bacterium]
MRSILIALALAAPLSAVAATPTYSNPMTSLRHHAPKEELVPLTFVNNSSQEREVLIGDTKYVLRLQTTFEARVPVGSVVRVYSNQNTKVNGQELMQVSAADANKRVMLR